MSMLNNIIINGLGESTVSQTYTLPDGKQYTLTEAQYDAFVKAYNEAYGIAYSNNMQAPRVADVLKYGQIVADWYREGMVFSEDKYNSQQEAAAAAAEAAAAEAAAAQRAAAERAAAEAAAAAAAAERAAAERAAAEAAAAQRAAAERAAAEAAAAAAAAERAAAERAAAEAAAAERAAAERAAAEAAAEDDRIYYLNLNRALDLGVNSPSYDAFKRMSEVEKSIWFAQIQLAENERNAQTEPPEVKFPDIIPTVHPSENKQGGSFPWLAVAIFGAITIGAIVLSKSKPKKRR